MEDSSSGDHQRNTAGNLLSTSHSYCINRAWATFVTCRSSQRKRKLDISPIFAERVVIPVVVVCKKGYAFLAYDPFVFFVESFLSRPATCKTCNPTQLTHWSHTAISNTASLPAQCSLVPAQWTRRNWRKYEARYCRQVQFRWGGHRPTKRWRKQANPQSCK